MKRQFEKQIDLGLTADQIHTHLRHVCCGCASISPSCMNVEGIQYVIDKFENRGFLESLSDYCCGHGVEALYDKDGCTPIAEYISFGDTYSPTLLYDIKESKFELTSWGAWYEEWESKRQQAIKLEYAGSVSSGTLRSDDLIPRFLDVAEEIAERLKNDYNIGECAAYRKRYNSLSDNAPEEDWDYLLDEITCLMNELSMCPDGYYFGAHPGDGADFGFWKNPE